MTTVVRRPLAAALAYAQAQVPVVPVQRNKRPYFKGWLDAASSDPAEVEAWWRQWPDANIVTPTGKRSGFFVVDVDPRNGGDTSLAQLVAQHGPLPATLSCATGGDGSHYYFSLPTFPVRSRDLAPGLEILGERKAVTLPPSVHASGREYRWVGDVRTPVTAPGWLLSRVRPRHASATHPPSRRRVVGPAYLRRAIEGECDAVRQSREGTRNSRLNRAAFALGRLVGAALLDDFDARRALLSAALGCGLGEREAIATIRSGLRAGIAQPRVLTRRRRRR